MSEQVHCHILWQDKLPLQVHTQLQVRGALHGKSWILSQHVALKSPLLVVGLLLTAVQPFAD